MSTVIDSVSTHYEKVKKTVIELYEGETGTLAGMIERDKSGRILVSRYLYRIPLEQYLGGNFHKINMDGGAMGVGTGPKYTHLTAGYIATARSYRITDEQITTSGSEEQAAVNVWNRTMSKAISQSQIDDDITLHGDGTGKLTNASSATNGTTTLTFAGVTDTLGVNRLKEGMVVDIWDSTGATLRAPSSGTAPTVITNIDYGNKIVTLSQTIASLTFTDLLAFPDLDVYGPSALTSFSSTWPGGALSTGAGLTGDSFRHGIYYSNDATTSNYYLGRLKSTISQLLPSAVDGLSSALTFDMVLKGLDQVIQRRDKEVLKGLRGVAHMSQRRSVFGQGVNISNWQRGQGANKMPDLMPSNVDYDSTFDMCGVTVHVDRRQYTDRIDFINPKAWKRAQTKSIHLKNVGGKTAFEVRNGDGEMVTETEFHVINEFDFVNEDPGIGMYVHTLQVPA